MAKASSPTGSTPAGAPRSAEQLGTTAAHAPRLELEPLDTTIQIVTPENIAFEYRLAGPFRRLTAYLLDMGIRIAIAIGTLFTSVWLFGVFGFGALGWGVALVAWFILEWFYGGLFETFWNGQTPGKRLVGLRVLSTTGQPINGYQAILRNFLRSADAMPMFCYQFGLISCALTKRFQRLGDLAADTMVVVEERQRVFRVQRVDEPAVRDLAVRLPTNLVISRSLARALSTYVERRARFTWAARCEIAWHLAEPLRQLYALPAATNPDTLLCALYQRAFITAGHESDTAPHTAAVVNPWPVTSAQPAAVEAREVVVR